jgi:tellurite resistance protein
VQTFNPERTMDRARKVLPDGSWEALDDRQRELVLRSAWVVTVVDGDATPDELTAIDLLTRFLGVKPAAATAAKATKKEDLLRALEQGPRDRSFAQHLYAAGYLVGMSDGVLLDSERRWLEELAGVVGLDPTSRVELERDLHGILYEELLVTVFKDGVVSARERQILNASRKLLGLDNETATHIEQALRERMLRSDSGAY